MSEQIKTDGLAIHLPSEIIQWHQEGRREQVRIFFDIPLVAVAGLDVIVAALKYVLLVAMQQVMAKLMGDGESLAALRADGTVIDDQPLRPRLVCRKHPFKTIEVLSQDLVDRGFGKALP